MSEGGAVAVYFFDSSAIVKRYAAEPGSSWVDSICDETAGNIVALSYGLRVNPQCQSHLAGFAAAYLRRGRRRFAGSGCR